jgi:DNA-binding MarR family transcriptional regulator
VLESTPTLIAHIGSDAKATGDPSAPSGLPWGLLTKHGRLLGLLAQHADLRIKDIAEALGTTQRTAQVILGELIEAGVVARTKVGRRNTYQVGPPSERAARMALERDLRAFSDVLAALGAPPPPAADRVPHADPPGPASAA